MSDLAPGMLLLATPALLDPNFADTVVLLLDVSDTGALGVVLNRPTSLAVSEVLGPWGEVVAEPEVLFRGGPVETDSALAVALRQEADDELASEPGDAAALTAPADAHGLRRVLGRLAILDLDTPPAQVQGVLAGLRIFAGYAGWGANQLQGEIDEGHWYVVAGEAVDVFRADTSTLLRDVLRRQPGDLAWHSTRPLDPDLN